MNLHVLFIPFNPEFLKWNFLSLNLDKSIDENRGFSLKSKNKMVNSVAPDETAHYEPFH